MTNDVRKAIVTDCVTLVESFNEHQTTDFKVFCKEWKRLHFQYIYSGLSQPFEMIQMTDELFNVTKEILFSINRSKLEHIGALYLIYALYFKQPTREYCKIKLNLKNWCKLKSFIYELKLEGAKTEQAVYIFYKLLKSNAFRFVVFESDYGFEDFYEVLDHQPHKKNSPLMVHNAASLLQNDLNEIKDSKKGLLNGIQILENGYNEMKSKIHLNDNEKLESTTIFEKLKLNFEKIANILEVGQNKNTDDDDNLILDSRVKIKSKAKNVDEAGNSETRKASTTDGEYTISISKDFIKIIRRTKKCSKPISHRIQTASSILDEELPINALSEAETIEGRMSKGANNPEPSTSKQANKAKKEKIDRAKLKKVDNDRDKSKKQKKIKNKKTEKGKKSKIKDLETDEGNNIKKETSSKKKSKDNSKVKPKMKNLIEKEIKAENEISIKRMTTRSSRGRSENSKAVSPLRKIPSTSTGLNMMELD